MAGIDFSEPGKMMDIKENPGLHKHVRPSVETSSGTKGSATRPSAAYLNLWNRPASEKMFTLLDNNAALFSISDLYGVSTLHGGGIVVGKKQDLVRQHYSFCDAEFCMEISNWPFVSCVNVGRGIRGKATTSTKCFDQSEINKQPDEKEHASSVIQDSCAGAFTGFHNNDRDFLPSVYGEIQANVVSEGKQLLHENAFENARPYTVTWLEVR
ncbi:hypothetical protein V8F44DRAFT_564933 [Aspergillus fumigatus]